MTANTPTSADGTKPSEQSSTTPNNTNGSADKDDSERTTNDANKDAEIRVDLDTDTEHPYEYQCPYCSATYTSELLARVHVERSSDTRHINRSGFMPETDIQIINPDTTPASSSASDSTSELVDTVSRRPEELSPDDIEIEHFPDEYTRQHKHILLAAARNPYADEYSQVHDLAVDRLQEAGLDQPSYATTRRIVIDFFEPHRTGFDNGDVKNTSDESERERKAWDNRDHLADLTPIQQAIVISVLAHPDAADTEIARRVGCAQSYPSRIRSESEHIISRLRRDITNGLALENAVVRDLQSDDVEALVRQELLNDIDIDDERLVELSKALDTYLESHAPAPKEKQTTESDDPTHAATDDVTQSETTSDNRMDSSRADGDAGIGGTGGNELRDRPVSEQRKVLSASPYDDAGTVGTASSDGSEQDSAGDNKSSTNDVVDGDSSPSSSDAHGEIAKEAVDSADMTLNEFTESTPPGAADADTGGVGGGASGESCAASVSREAVRAVRNKVAFIRRIAEAEQETRGRVQSHRESHGREHGQTSARIAVAAVIETELNQVLGDSTHSRGRSAVTSDGITESQNTDTTTSSDPVVES